MRILLSLLLVSSCGMEDQLNQQDSSLSETTEEATEEEKTASGTSVTIENTVTVNGGEAESEVKCEAPIEYLVDSKKQTWEQAGINAPHGYRVIERYEFIKAYDEGKFDDYRSTYTSYWTMTQQGGENEYPVAVSLSTSGHQAYNFSTKLSAIYISDCNLD